MKHVVVHSEKGMFYGWPANNGIWAWGDEIAVGFTEAFYEEKEDDHSQDESKPRRSVIARSTDGGESWRLERPEGYPEGFSFAAERSSGDGGSGLAAPLDFTNPELAIRCRCGHFIVSRDRCRSWEGPYWFPTFGFTEGLTARTDYLPLGRSECLFFLSVHDPAVQAGISDRAFAALTTDGGLTFEFLGYMLPDNPEVRSVMPSTVRTGSRRLVSALRRRFDHEVGGAKTYCECWIDAAVSEDRGRSWRFAGRITDTHTRESQHNGNPPSLVGLEDNRLCAVYGYRAPAYGMRARISCDEGSFWGREIVLRDDARTWDIGYPRSTVRPDGKVVSIYYYTTDALREQHIAATIWDPKEERWYT